MVDEVLAAKIEELEKEYERVYGKKPVISKFPVWFNQRIMIEVLELMIADNLSFVVACSKVKGRNLDKQDIKEEPFDSQSETLIEYLVDERGYSQEEAEKLWFSSKTYKEIIHRGLTYISAMRALYELDMELENHPDWMDKPFDL